MLLKVNTLAGEELLLNIRLIDIVRKSSDWVTVIEYNKVTKFYVNESFSYIMKEVNKCR